MIATTANFTSSKSLPLKNPNDPNVIFLSRIHSKNFYLHKPVMADHWHKIALLAMIILLLFTFLIVLYYQRILFHFIYRWIYQRKAPASREENIEILHQPPALSEYSHVDSTHVSKAHLFD